MCTEFPRTVARRLEKPRHVFEHNWPGGTMPVLSILCLTYNHGEFIVECLEGFLTQATTFPVEIIIHDDASTDGTADIIRDYHVKYPSIFRLKLQTKNQMQAGRNVVIPLYRAARGEYIALCEGDDYWTSTEKLEKQVGFLERNHSYSGSAHQTQLVNEDGTLGRVIGQFDELDLAVTHTISTLSPWHSSAFVFRREFLYIPDWFCHILSTDMAMFTIVARNGPIRCFPEVMSVYRKHAGGITSTADVISTYHQKRIELMQYLDDYLNGQYHNHVQEVIQYHRTAIDHERKTAEKHTRQPGLGPRVKQQLRALLRWR